MPSRLSSLLVRDGLVGVKRMEKAFQRQVIYGGSLDTILLEMSLVPEDRLVQYLALASGLPPAARHDGEEIEIEAVALISRELAEQYRTVPVALEGDAVRVLVCAPLEISELEDLADHMDRALQPLIAPEYRWNLVFAAAYGLEPPARFTQLARMLDGDTATTPAVGRPKSVIVSGADDAEHDAEPALAPRAGAKVSGDADTLKLTGGARAATPEPPKRRTIVGLVPARGRAEAGRPGEPAERKSGALPASVGRTQPRPPSSPIPTEGRDAPLPVVPAREALMTAEDRDTVFLTLLRAVRSRAKWAGLLTVQGGAAIGRLALAEPGLDTASITTVLIPLDAISPFGTVVSNRQPHIGPLASGDAGVDEMVARMGGQIPPSGLILPIVLRARVVALVVAHRVQADLRIFEVAELLPMALSAADALGRLLVKHKAGGYRTPQIQASTELEDETAPNKRRRAATVPEDTARFKAVAPPPPAGAPAAGTTPPPNAEADLDEDEPPAPIDDVLWVIESSREGTRECDNAIAEAVDRTEETLDALAKRFPGRLRIDRFAVSGRPLRPAQYGGLLELVVRLGSTAAELLINKLAATQRDVRF